MSVGENSIYGPSMSEHEGLQLRHELSTLIPGDEAENVLKGMRERALNYLVGTTLAGMQTPDEARELAGQGTLHVVRHQDEVIERSVHHIRVRP